MIVVRVPLRITLGGGGSDAPEYASEHGGFAVTAAISRHIYVSVNKTFAHDYLLRYSQTERVDTLSGIAHPILREALRYYDVPPGVEIVSMSDIPAGTGLGSSGVFGVALCMALAEYTDKPVTRSQTISDAAHIELDILQRPGGQQDHWAGGLGGVRATKFGQNGQIDSAAIDAPDSCIAELQDSLHLYYTGQQRDADSVLATQTTDGLDEIKHLGYRVHHMIVAGNITGIGELMNEHWQYKCKRSGEMSNPAIDAAYRTALKNGAIGGKLVGAGGGGFILAVSLDAGDRLTKSMARIGMPEIPFRFDNIGATLITTA